MTRLPEPFRSLAGRLRTMETALGALCPPSEGFSGLRLLHVFATRTWTPAPSAHLRLELAAAMEELGQAASGPLPDRTRLSVGRVADSLELRLGDDRRTLHLLLLDGAFRECWLRAGRP